MTISQIIAVGAVIIVIIVVSYVRSTTKISPRLHVDYLSAEAEKKRLQDKKDRKSIKGWQRFFAASSGTKKP